MGILAVIVTILKIIGFLLLGVIGLVLLVLALILFVPIRYEGKGSYDGQPILKAKVHYLLHLVQVDFRFKESEMDLSARILWFSLWNSSDQKTTRKRSKKKSPKNQKQKQKIRQSKDPLFEDEFYQSSPTAPKPLELEMSKSPQSERKAVSKEPAPQPEKKQNKEQKGIFKKWKERYNKIKIQFHHIMEQREKIMKELQDEGNQDAIKKALEALGKILKHLLPVRHRIRIYYGTGDPATTGEYLGMASAFSVILGLNLLLYPDFEEKIFHGDAFAKGRIRVFTLLYIAVRLYFNKNVKILIRRYRSM